MFYVLFYILCVILGIILCISFIFYVLFYLSCKIMFFLFINYMVKIYNVLVSFIDKIWLQ